MIHPIRRVVTGHGEDGKSKIIMDSDATSVKEMAAFEGLGMTDLWETKTMPASNAGNEDAGDREVILEPTKSGTIFRVVEFPPDKSWKGNEAESKAAFEAIGAGHAKSTTSTDAMMHKTDTVDYLFVLKGEIWAVMEEGETCLKQGDVMIQRGTMHSWSVRTDEPCLLGVVLVSADPV